MYTHTHTHTHTLSHTHINTHIHKHTHTHAHTHTHIHTYTHSLTHSFILTHSLTNSLTHAHPLSLSHTRKWHCNDQYYRPIPKEMHSFSSLSHVDQVNSIPAPFPQTHCISIPTPFPLQHAFPFSSCYRQVRHLISHPFHFSSISIPFSHLTPRLLLRLCPSRPKFE